MTEDERTEVLETVRSLVASQDRMSKALDGANAQLAEVVKSNTALSEKYDALVRKDRRDSRNFRILVVSVVFDILLSAGVIVGLGRANTAAQDAKAATSAAHVAQNNLKVTCEAVNTANAATLGLFEDLAASAPAPVTVEAKARQEEALGKIRKTYAPRSC